MSTGPASNFGSAAPLPFNLPDDLTELDRWILWRKEQRNGRLTKVPYSVNGNLASVTNAATWSSYEDAMRALERAAHLFSGLGFVFAAGDGIVGVDLDNCLDSDGNFQLWARPYVEPFSDTYCERSPSGRGVQAFLRGQLPGPGRRKTFDDHAVEIYNSARFFCVTGQPLNDAPLQIEEHQNAIEKLYAELGGSPTEKPLAAKAINERIPQGQRHNTLVSLAGSLRRRGLLPNEIDASLQAVNIARCDPPYDGAHVRKIAESAGRWEPGTDLSAGPSLLPQLHNDHGNACRLIALHGDDLRYCHSIKSFLIWDGRRWAADKTGHAQRLAKDSILEFLRQALDGDVPEATKFAKASLEARRIANMLQMAQSERYIESHELDTNTHLLNFNNGTVDLRTAALRPHRREDFITKVIHYAYEPTAECPRWIEFLAQIMGGGPDASAAAQERAGRLLDYLQRALGYSLTGCTIEKAVFVPFGEGNNGKSTLLDTFRTLIEEYAVLLQVDTLMVRQESNNTQADLADLRGARFVQTSETEERQRLAQGKLKRITQGMGKIKACKKYENPIEFPETHKLWMDTNRKPVLRDADDIATFNRLHPIPFTVVIQKEKINKNLQAELLAEAEGILAWAVKGARLWFESGLMKPDVVKDAVSEWRSETDQIGRFIEECCTIGNRFTVQATAIYGSYKRWCETGGEHPITANAFGRKLTDKGFGKRHLDTGTRYDGIGFSSQGVSRAD